MNRATHTRCMLRRDLPRVLAIERASFDTPWTREQFIERLRQRNVIGMVAEDATGEVIEGFAVYALHKRRVVIENIAVDPDCRCRGVGSTMVRKLQSKLHPQRRVSIRADVRETNLVGQLFFRACGLAATNIARGVYRDCAEDAYEMEYRLNPSNRITHFFQDSP